MPGTGLGLSQVREIMTLHQGHALISSAPGKDTQVTLWLLLLPYLLEKLASSPYS
ncbi:sensor histidine kinase [Rhodoferax sp. 4810]|nr:sensor histidine kinase [Rhodoferax jenense]